VSQSRDDIADRVFPFAKLPRRLQKRMLERETALRKSGAWGEWMRIKTPKGVGPVGWQKEVFEIFGNQVFSVLVRRLQIGGVHIAVASRCGDRPTWEEMQRVKNEIMGAAATAVEVYPPDNDADYEDRFYHLWSVNALPFSLKEQKAPEPATLSGGSE
jgi:hypothetical protein